MPRRNRVVAIAPTGNYLDWGSCVLRRVVTEAGGGASVRLLWGSQATPGNARSAVLDFDPILVAGIGHGAPCVYTVYALQPFLAEMDTRLPQYCYRDLNLDLSRGRIWHLNSCLVGSMLGRDMVEKHGAVVFAGSRDLFWFYIGDPPCSTDASMAVFRAEYEFTRQLLHGRSVGEAHEARLRAFDYWIDYFTTGPGRNHRHASIIVRLLTIDKNIAVVYGDMAARAVSPAPAVGDLWSMGILAVGAMALISSGRSEYTVGG